MAVSLATLKSRLQSDVPARGDFPEEEQYERAVVDAVADYGRRRSLRKVATLSIVSGTATYDLPVDFLEVISLESLTSPGGVIHGSSGLIPVSATYSEEFYVAGLEITFYPTPQYSTTRDLWYAAGYVLDDDDVYQDMTEDVARVASLKAQAIALQLQANKAAQEAWQYAIGDERVSKERLAEALGKQAKALLEQYEAEMGAQVGPVGMRAKYNALGL